MIQADNSTNTLKAAYTGKDIIGFAEINRNKLSKTASVTIHRTGEWKLYTGTSVDGINLQSPILSGSGMGTFQLDVPASARTYFLLETVEGKAILAERHLPMEGGFNFRDLGGIKTKDGRYTRWGKVFRSDDLHNLTPDDLNYLSGIPIISIVDFRSESEMKAAPDKVPASTLQDYAYSINPGNISDAAGLYSFSDMDINALMKTIYTTLVTDAGSIKYYKRFFALLQDEKQVPLLFHCSAGKDRTGIGAALFLKALGVDNERILEDYLLSNTYIGEKYAGYTLKYPELKPLFEVKPEYIMTALRQVEADCGSVDNYLEKILKVDMIKLRKMFLY